MAEFALNFAVSYIMTRLSQKNGPRLRDLRGFQADYGASIPLNFGPENRVTELTVMWATPIVETVHKHKPVTDYLFGIVGALLPSQKTYTYSVSFALLIGGNPIRRVVKMWLNKKVAFDAGDSTALVFTTADGTHKDFATLRVYPGSWTQTPDPTIEMDKGVGNVTSYRGLSYCVVDTLQLKNYNNGVPQQIELLVEEAETASLRRITATLCDHAGFGDIAFSNTALQGNVRGYRIDSQVTVADALQPLAEAFTFDVADICGGLRMVPRGRYPISRVTPDQLAGHDVDAERPEPIRFTRAVEAGLPHEVTFSFADPARDYQPNSQTVRRKGGSSQSNIVLDSGLTVSADDGLRIADQVMWQAWASREGAATTTDDRRRDLVACDIHVFETPNGLDTYRITRRTRGANGVIELQMEADRPLIYNSVLPGVPAPTDAVSAPSFHPINDPIFIEPPPGLASDAAELMIAVSGSDGVLVSGGSTYSFDPRWTGLTVYVATSNVEASYRVAGFMDAPSYMGFLTAPLAISSGATPDDVNELFVDMTMSGGVLSSVSDDDAASGKVNLAYIDDGAEFLTITDATATAPYNYIGSGLYRGLYGSAIAGHAAGVGFAMIDDSVFRMTLAADQVGVELFFKFVQNGQALSDVTAYPYTPSGLGYGSGVGGVPATPTDVIATPSPIGALVVWQSADATTSFDVYRADGLGASFGSATFVGSTQGTSFTDTSADALTAYTWFVVAHNAVGASGAASAGTTTTAGGGGSTVVITASEALTAGRIVSFWNSGGAKVRHADNTDDTKQADGFVLDNVANGAPATVYLPGSVNTAVAALTPGALYFLGTAGQITAVVPSSGWLQEIGKAADATHLPFAPKQGTLL